MFYRLRHSRSRASLSRPGDGLHALQSAEERSARLQSVIAGQPDERRQDADVVVVVERAGRLPLHGGRLVALDVLAVVVLLGRPGRLVFGRRPGTRLRLVRQPVCRPGGTVRQFLVEHGSLGRLRRILLGRHHAHIGPPDAQHARRQPALRQQVIPSIIFFSAIPDKLTTFLAHFFVIVVKFLLVRGFERKLPLGR